MLADTLTPANVTDAAVGAGSIRRRPTFDRAFAAWAPRALEAVDKSFEAIFSDFAVQPCDPPRRSQPPRARARTGKKPEDEYAVERSAWYAELAEEYGGVAQYTDDDGLVKVWTDGGFDPESNAAGYGIFYGDGNPCNVAAPLDSHHRSAPRAELAALARLLESDSAADPPSDTTGDRASEQPAEEANEQTGALSQ